MNIPESQYRYILPPWKQAILPVAMNKAGEATRFFPDLLKQEKGRLYFSQELKEAVVTATWKMDPQFAGDVIVDMALTARADGYFSLSSPSLAIVAPEELEWAMVPGHFQGRAIEKNFVKAFGYGQGIPALPVVTRERTASTLSPLVTTKNGDNHGRLYLLLATSRDPWEFDHSTQNAWQLGLSVMNRDAQLTPVAWHPVLGEKGSYLQQGDTVSFAFRYSLQAADWYTVYKHAVNDIYVSPISCR